MPPKTDLPFDGKTLRFITFYVQFEDLQKAAQSTHLPVAVAKKLYRNGEVRAEIDHRLDMIYREQAKLEASAKKVEVLFLDDQLVTAVKKGAARGDIKALELGYERLGLRRDGNFMTGAQSSDQSRPNVYRALEHSVTRTQQITERTVLTEVRPEPLVQVLDY